MTLDGAGWGMTETATGTGVGAGGKPPRVVYELDRMSEAALGDLHTKLGTEITEIEEQIKAAYLKQNTAGSAAFIDWKSRAEYAVRGKHKFQKKIEYVLAERRTGVKQEQILAGGGVVGGSANTKNPPRPRPGRDLAAHFMDIAERILTHDTFEDIKAEAKRDAQATKREKD